MPIYEYECQKCKTHLEVMQKVSDKPLTKCKECGGKLEKQWSNTSFQFKGSGWYVTDYAGKKGDGASEKKVASTDDKTASEAPAESKGETKVESGTDTKSKTDSSKTKKPAPVPSGD